MNEPNSAVVSEESRAVKEYLTAQWDALKSTGKGSA
jgi:hypothetical protein